MGQTFMPVADFKKLEEQEQYDLLLNWRNNCSDKTIMRGMGASNSVYYRLVKGLNLPPKANNPFAKYNKKVSDTEEKKELPQVQKQAQTQEQEAVVTQSKVVDTNKPFALSINTTTTKDVAQGILNSMMKALGEQEFYFKIETIKE